MPGSILGNAVVRVEDPELLVGAGAFVGDLPADGLLHAAFVRSSVAHGRVLSVDVSDARTQPGVVGAFTAADLELPAFHGLAVLNADCARPPLATDKVRFVGEPVAVVVADSAAAAVDAAEAVVVDIEPLPAVVDPEAALADGAPLQFEELGTNLAAGLGARADDALAGADVVVRGRLENQRIAVAPLECDAVAVHPATDGTVTAYVSTQMPHLWRDTVTRLFELDPGQLRVITPHVGGAFGGKAGASAEHLVVVAVARRLGRPVRWVQSRSENLVAMHGRGQVQYGELGLRRDGTITGLRCRIAADAGAYAGFGGALALGPTRSMAQGPYRIPTISYAAAAAMTNTAPVGAFRGAGRPEATALLERLVDLAAFELDIDPVELRRRNLLGADQFPFRTAMGTTYDCGDYQAALDEVVRLAGYDELRRDQAERRSRGDHVQLGIGVSTYVEVTAGGGGSEFGAVEVHTDGTATIRVGTSGHGQGHATSFSMIVADRLGIPMEAIRFVQSDTAVVPRGGGTGGSRSLQIGGNAVGAAADAVLVQARELAAAHLEAAPADI
nr:xanthine dehydrogenase family protein molybdopterin-binding subunit [Acidimicrobiia bacterium]